MPSSVSFKGRELLLKTELDRLLQEFSPASRLAHDPLQFARRYLEEGRRKAEIEALALFSAMLSYGRVDLFLGVIRKVLGLAEDRFLDFITQHPRDGVYPPDGVYTREKPRMAYRSRVCPVHFPNYRLSTAPEIWIFAKAVGWVVQVDGGLFHSFQKGFAPSNSIRDGLISLRARILEGIQVPITPGLAHLLPDPALGGACKRWLMFLRWMVRPDDGLDLGLWREISPSLLLIPIDRHVSAIARALGFTTRKSDDWKTTEEITLRLRTLDPDDPVKYDFALAHLGISGTCTHGRDPEACLACQLRPLCSTKG